MKIDINKIKHIYMIGIGGISMSGIAEILVKWGYQVSGSDGTKSNQTDWLEKNGIKVSRIIRPSLFFLVVKWHS